MARPDPAMAGALGYPRRALDHYPTIDEDVTRVLLPVLGEIGFREKHLVWECAAGAGDMAKVIKTAFPELIATDIEPKSDRVDWLDFLTDLPPEIADVDLIITNPPYDIADAFFVRAAELAESYGIHTFMVCRNEFDSASEAPRAAVFDGPYFRGKLPLRWRPRWFEEGPDGGAPGSPRHNYAWFWIGPGIAPPVVIHLDRDKTVKRRRAKSARAA